MALQSMTGFSRAQGSVSLPQGGEAHWVWEIRSVNGKGLDFRLRLPPGLESIENDCRKLAAGAFSRGNLQASLQYDKRNSTALPVVNEAALAAILTHVERLRIELGSLPPAAETILSMKGVLEIAETGESEEAVEMRNAALLAGLDQALRELVVMRSSEGRAIAQVLVGHVAEIARLTAAVEVDPSRQPAAIRERLAQQLALILDADSRLDPQRLHQEAAILATKADLREEIDRLKAHVDAANLLLKSPGPSGRKLDFLAQEFNRECNTICSKSNAASVTALGLEMKVVIDQFREQVQNLE
ncbi:MAG: YicC family protein [Nitratireductor sp.]|nr:YicC family protein [Nitratireductor sp.]